MKGGISKYVADWFARGDDDLKTAETLLGEEGIPNVICFHTQQAGEKYLKGFLAHHEKHIRKIHDLDTLVNACKDVDASFESLRDATHCLAQFYVESRYPDDYIEFHRGDAEKAFDAALRIKAFVVEKLGN